MNRYKSSTKIKPESSANIIFEEQFEDGEHEPQKIINPRFKSIPSKATLILEDEMLNSDAHNAKLKQRPIDELKMTILESAQKIQMNNYFGSKKILDRKTEPTPDQLNPEKHTPQQAVEQEDSNQKLAKLVQKQIEDRQKWQKMAEQKQKSLHQNSSHILLNQPSQTSQNPLVIIHNNGDTVKKAQSKQKLQKIATQKYEVNNLKRNDLLKSSKGQQQQYVNLQPDTKPQQKQESTQKKKRAVSELRPLKKKLATHQVMNQLDMIKKKQGENADNDSHKRSMLKRRIHAKDIQDIELFNRQEFGRGMYIEGTLERNRSGLCNVMFPEYRIVFDDENILYAKKTMKGYDIMLDPSHPDILQSKKLASVKGNFIGSYYNIYEGEDEKQILTTIFYNPDSKSVTREVELYMKKTGLKYWDCDRDNDNDTAFYSLKSLYLQGDNRCDGKIRKYVSKQPFFDQKTKSYKLDFGGKATVLSVKNVILVEAQNPKQKVFVFGKCGDNTFSFKAEHPLSPVVIMGYLMTSFNFKFSTQ